jgi:hypothetical protein
VRHKCRWLLDIERVKPGKNGRDGFQDLTRIDTWLVIGVDDKYQGVLSQLVHNKWKWDWVVRIDAIEFFWTLVTDLESSCVALVTS